MCTDEPCFLIDVHGAQNTDMMESHATVVSSQKLNMCIQIGITKDKAQLHEFLTVVTTLPPSSYIEKVSHLEASSSPN